VSSLSRKQVDQLGDRLRRGSVSENDLRLLDAYRESFAEAYEEAVATIRTATGLDAAGRWKTNFSIIGKLLRESTMRLTRMQDVTGCRVVVANILEQDSVVERLIRAFPASKTYDRREKPSYGYRAVHVIATAREKLVEIQVRTELQHLWAQLSERLSDLIDPTIKYGGGEHRFRELLDRFSEETRDLEDAQASRAAVENALDRLLPDLPVHLEGKALEAARRAVQVKVDLAETERRFRRDMEDLISHAEAVLKARGVS